MYRTMVHKLEEVEKYYEDLKKLAEGLSDEVYKKYQEIMKNLDKEFALFKKKVNEITKDIKEFSQDQIDEVQKQIEIFDNKLEKHLKDAIELLNEASEKAPELIESFEKNIKDFYNNLKAELPKWGAANPKNMFKHNVIKYLEEFEPETAQQYKDYASLQTKEYELTHRYVGKSSTDILGQLYNNQDVDNTRLA